MFTPSKFGVAVTNDARVRNDRALVLATDALRCSADVDSACACGDRPSTSEEHHAHGSRVPSVDNRAAAAALIARSATLKANKA